MKMEMKARVKANALLKEKNQMMDKNFQRLMDQWKKFSIREVVDIGNAIEKQFDAVKDCTTACTAA